MKKLILGLVLGSSVLSLQAAVLNFSNPSSISLNEPATTHTAPTVASPYPSTISVSGVTDPVSTIRVILNNINQPRPDDMDMLLVSPTGVKFVPLSDVGGTSVGAVGVNLTLGDSGAGPIPDLGPLVTGTYQPTCVDNANNINTIFPAPAPAGPYLAAAPRGAATFASAFAGINVNGTWSLYALDDSLNSPQTASITGGWTIEITTAPSAVATVTTLTSSNNPSFTTSPSNSVIFTALVTKQSDGTPVTSGTVTFREGGTTLAANVAVNGTGRAFYTNTTFTEGTHAITADYNGAAGFLTSSGNTTQTVNNHTVVAGSTFCNTGVIVFADAVAPGGANVYPSRIFVGGLGGTISKVTVQIKSLNHPRPDDIDLLLVSPSGAKFILLSDAGGTVTAASGANVTFDDAAATTVPDGGPIVTGTFRPSSYTAADTFPAPAPAGPYLTPEVEGGDTLAAFNGATPNGTWTLYVVDDVVNGGQVNTIALGWCLTFVTSGDAATTTVLGSSAFASFTGDPVVFTAWVTSSDVPVTQGTVTFKEGATTLAGPIALNASGQAKYTNSAFTEGTHTITAVYNGSPGFFNTSSGNWVQEVNNRTVVVGNSYCNTGIVFFADAGAPGIATPYPSRVFVSGVTGTVNKVTVQLKTLNHIRPDDIDILLVDPRGAVLVLMSDAGGTTVAAAGVTLTFDDAAASLLPDDVTLVSGTYRPTQHGAGDPFPGFTPGSFGEPAPAGSATLASSFTNDANGAWSLYVVDDVANGGQGATIANGWCVNIIACVAATITAPPAVCGNSTGNQASGPAGVSSYAWTISNGTITSATNLQTITYTAGPAGNVTLNLTVTSSTGCGQSNSVTVPITGAPAVPTIAPTPSSLCPNSVGNQASGPAGATTYSWTITNGTITSATNIQNVLYMAGTSGNVGLGLRVGNAAGCTASNFVNVPIVVDATPPTVTCPGNITVTATGNCPAVVFFNPTGSDNCSSVTITSAPPSGSSFPVGTTQVKVTARDSAGNTNTCMFNVTVLAGTAPRLTAGRSGTNVVLSWPSAYTCYTLQYTPRLFPSPVTNAWTNFPGPFTTNAGRTYVTNSTSSSNRFFRLLY